MTREPSKGAWPRLVGWLIVLAPLLSANATATQYRMLADGVWMGLTPGPEPNACLLSYDPRPPLPLYAPSVGIRPRVLAYPATWPVPREPLGICAVPRYLPAPTPTIIMSPYGLRPRPLGLPPAAFIGNSLVSGPVYPRLADCRAR
jgi:hypothetical protein